MSERIDWAGVEAVNGQKVYRDPYGRVTAVGTKKVLYDGLGRPGTVGGEKVTYDAYGNPTRVGNTPFPVVLPPSSPAVDNSYHPAAGLFLEGEDPNSKPEKRRPAGGADVAGRERRANIEADLVVVWVWPVVLLLPTFILTSLARHDRLPIGPWGDYATEFFHVAATLTVATLAMSALVVMANYATPAEPDGDHWDVKPLFPKDGSARNLPGIYLVLVIPSVFVYGMLALITGRELRADFNAWTFLPALVLPGALYLFLQVSYRWKMRRVHRRYFGSVIVSNNNVVHHGALQDDEGNATTEPKADGFLQAVVCYVLLTVFTMLVQS